MWQIPLQGTLDTYKVWETGPSKVSRLPAGPSSLTQLVKLGKVLISSLPHIYGFMYIMWFVTACSFIWYLVWKFALQLSFGWWKIEQLKIIKKIQFPLICFFFLQKVEPGQRGMCCRDISNLCISNSWAGEQSLKNRSGKFKKTGARSATKFWQMSKLRMNLHNHNWY